jgi:crotonobetainyl-CoA:carnitine CoA-transferase CaiB-like acyl-CoA transferase
MLISSYINTSEKFYSLANGFNRPERMISIMMFTVHGEVRQQVVNYGFSSYIDYCMAKDGWVYIAPLSDSQWRKFAAAIDREDMASDPQFSNDMLRCQNRDLIHDTVSQWVAERRVDEVIDILERVGVVVGRVNTVAEMMDDATVKHREMIVPLEHPGLAKIPIPGIVPKLSVTPGRIKGCAPRIGEHNEGIYIELLGLSREELREARKIGVI